MVLRELALDPTTGDLQIVRGQLVILEGAAAVAQRIRTYLSTLLGEWVFDTSIGVPWIQQVLNGQPSEGLIREIISGQVRAIDGVARLNRIDLDLNRTTRNLTATIDVTAETGETVVVSQEAI